jgi:hypothetical protein
MTAPEIVALVALVKKFVTSFSKIRLKRREVCVLGLHVHTLIAQQPYEASMIGQHNSPKWLNPERNIS